MTRPRGILRRGRKEGVRESQFAIVDSVPLSHTSLELDGTLRTARGPALSEPLAARGCELMSGTQEALTRECRAFPGRRPRSVPIHTQLNRLLVVLNGCQGRLSEHEGVDYRRMD